MAAERFISYLRVSTTRQGMSGLGLEAQCDAVQRYIASVAGVDLGQLVEVETGRGDGLKMRPKLREALERCRREKAILLIARLDRLSRSVRFVAELMESKVRFRAVDVPEANELTLHLLAAFAQHEAKRISERTREALARAKARGTVLGATWRANFNVRARRSSAGDFAERLRGQIEGFKLRGLTRRQMVEELNALGISAPRGGRWGLCAVQRLVMRLGARKTS